MLGDAPAPVAQLDRASVYGTEGHRFESCRARFGEHRELQGLWILGASMIRFPVHPRPLGIWRSLRRRDTRRAMSQENVAVVDRYWTTPAISTPLRCTARRRG